MSKPRCDCMECRIRAALRSGAPDDSFVDIEQAVVALGNVMAECLAHVPTPVAKRAAAELLAARKRWIKEPRVAVQQPPVGRA